MICIAKHPKSGIILSQWISWVVLMYTISQYVGLLFKAFLLFLSPCFVEAELCDGFFIIWFGQGLAWVSRYPIDSIGYGVPESQRH